MPSNSDVALIVEDLSKFTEGLIKDLTLDITANLIESTPVDTGWARANWVPSIGSPRTSTVGTRIEAEAGSVDTSAQSSGISSISVQYRLSQGAIFISNNVDYIVKLNEGTSAQAPAMFVEIAIEEAVSRARGLIK